MAAYALLIGVEAVLALPLLYLLVLSVAALAGSRRMPAAQVIHAPDQEPDTSHHRLARFALLIPAHDEEVVIGDLLASITALDYPAACRDAYVIADNCSDATADVAREAGAPGVEVWERHNTQQQGKGHALRWMLEGLEHAGRRYDAYVIVDADSRLSPNFLRAMAHGLAQGAVALQGQYRVQNEVGAWTASLRAVAFALFNHLRPLGRAALGWSAGLKGNGMCFDRSLIQRFGWDSYTLAEDAEYHLALVCEGIRVTYVPEAVVTSAMPTTLRQAKSQQQRWERGRLVLAKMYAVSLARNALRHRDLASLDAVFEVCLPPISLLVGGLALAVAGAVTLRWEPGLIAAGMLVAAFMLHGFAGMRLARLSPRAYLALLYVPWYVLWKIGIYARAAVSRGTGPWVRTSRVATLPSGSSGG